MSFTYNRDIPDAPNNPSNDQPKMKTNTNSIYDLINVDHVTFNDALAGTHNQSTYNRKAAKPAVAGTQVAVYSKLSGALSELFFESQNGDEYQLSNSTTSVVAANGPAIGTDGSTFLGGGIILKWGNFLATSFGSSSGTHNFNVAFPNACFNVCITQGDNTDANVNMQITAVSTTGFTYRQAKSPSNYYYIAIGN